MELQEIIENRFQQMEIPFQRKVFVNLKKEFISLLDEAHLSASKKDYVLHQLNNIHEIKELISFIDDLNMEESKKEIFDEFIISGQNLKIQRIRRNQNETSNQQLNKVQDLILNRDLNDLNVLVTAKLDDSLKEVLCLLTHEVKDLTLYYHTDIEESMRLRNFASTLPEFVLEKLNITSSILDAHLSDLIIGTESASLKIIQDSASQNEIITLDT